MRLRSLLVNEQFVCVSDHSPFVLSCVMDHFMSSSDVNIVPCGCHSLISITLKGEVIKTAKSLGDRSDVDLMLISNVVCDIL